MRSVSANGRYALPRRATRCQQLHGHRQYIVATLTQRRNRQWKYAQTVKQVLAEAPSQNLTTQIPVGRGDDPNVQRNRTTSADTFNFTLLQHPQQLGLQRQGHFGDFIEQQSAALSLFKLTGMGISRASEGSAFVAEQQRCAVDCDKLAGMTGGTVVDKASQHFFAGARFARDHHRAIGDRHALRQTIERA